jgi:hypothetical protein
LIEIAEQNCETVRAMCQRLRQSQAVHASRGANYFTDVIVGNCPICRQLTFSPGEQRNFGVDSLIFADDEWRKRNIDAWYGWRRWPQPCKST